MFHKSVLENTRHYESYTFTASPAHMKHPLYSIYFLDGVYLSSGTPLVYLVECLGSVGGTLDVALLMAGWGASVEMIGSVVSPTLLPLSTVAGVVTLVIGVTATLSVHSTG